MVQELCSGRKLLAVISFASLIICTMLSAGCSDNHAPAGKPHETAAPAIVGPRPAPGALTEEVTMAAGDSATLREVRSSGILRAAISCDRPPLCFKDKYGMARGFEVDLLRQTASAFGVKLNIVPPGEPAAISGPFPAMPIDTAPELIIYYYSRKTGWLAFRSEGDSGFRKALGLALTHLYDTGTYQQLFLNSINPAPSAGKETGGR